MVQQLSDGNGTGASLGQSTTDKVSLYGVTPIVQRSGATQATSLVGTASSTAVDTALKAAVIEIMDTLTAIGVWKGSA
jgi:imidazole glycerol phosphate synthase subunit HisF